MKGRRKGREGGNLKREKRKREGKEKEENWTKKDYIELVKKLIGFVCHILWKNLNKLLGQSSGKLTACMS